MDAALWNLCRIESRVSNRDLSPRYSKTRICLEWNDYVAGCSRHNCRYDHIRYRCAHLPDHHVDRNHREVSCPNKRKESQPNTSRPNHPSQAPHKYSVNNQFCLQTELISITETLLKNTINCLGPFLLYLCYLCLYHYDSLLSSPHT